MPDSTTNGITYPVPGDYVKAAEFASKLAKDFETLALTADQAIVAGVAQGIIPVLSGYVKPKPIPSGTDLLTLDTGWWYNRLTSVAGTMLNRPQGVTDGPFMVHMVRTPFGHSTITYYGYSGTAGGLFENHTGNAAHTAWVGWRRLDGTTGGGITQGSGLAGFANILRTQMFRDAMGPVTTGGKGAIAFRFDHGLSKFNSIIRPLLEARGIKYSLALSARNFDAGENAGVTASMVNSWTGAEVWNHGANQHQDESSVAGLTDQIVTGLTELQAALPNKQIWGYAVPGTGGSGQGGFFGGATAEQFYETAAGDLILTNHAVSSGSMSGTSRRPLDGRVRQGMAHFTIEAQTVARIKSEIDNAISNKTGNQLMMHPNLLNTEGYLTTSQLVEVLDYVVAKRDAGDLVVLSPYEMLVAQLSTSGGSGVPGPPGAGVPAGGEALQVIRKNAFNTTTEWATLTKSLVGLSNVDNTSDMNKPVSTMQKLALDEKIDAAKLPDEVDGVNKNLIEDTASLTNAALSAAIGKVVIASGDTTGTTDTATINTALLAGHVTLRGADYYTKTPIRIPSNRVLTLADASIHLVPDSNCNVIQNRDQDATGNTNIKLVGIGRAEIDGGNSTTQTNASAYNSIGVTFTNVNNLEVDGVAIGPCRGPAMVLQGVKHGRGRNIHIAQDRTGPNQDGIDFGPGNVDVEIDGVTGVTSDDLFSVFSQKTAGFTHSMYKNVAFAEAMTDITLKNATVDIGINPVRLQAGDGLRLERVHIENIVNLNRDLASNNYSVIAFGELSYVTTPPLKEHISNITMDGYRGRANVVIGAGTHFSKVKAANIVIDTPLKSVIGTAQASVNVAADMADIEVNNLTLTDATSSSAASLVALPSGAVLSGFVADSWNVRRCQAVLNNTGAVTSMSMSRVTIRNLLGVVCGSSIAELGYASDIVIQNNIAGPRFSGAPAKLVFGGRIPRLKAADVTPFPSKGSIIQCEAGKDPKGGSFANGGEYVADGAAWVLKADLGPSF